MGVIITRRGVQARFDPRRIAAIIKGVVPGMILERTNKGVDVNGQQFAPYSKRYKKRLRLMGEDPKIDLRLSGGLMNSIKARGATLHPDRVEVIIAPDTGTSPQYRAPSERRAYRQAGLAEGRFAERSVARTLTKAEGRAFAKSLKYETSGARRIATGKQSPPHNVVGYWLHNGTPKMKARPFMGLTDAQYTELLREIARICFR
jgi:hypothetical protein